MSLAFEKVRGVRELPLFPLPIVLFPGAPLPLHIFEERYRQLLRDAMAGNRLFGLSYFDLEMSALGAPVEGHLGCVAEIQQVETLPDGRSNVLTVGLIRYRVESFVAAGEPYLIGRVTFLEDELEDPADLTIAADKVRELFDRIGSSIHVLSNERGGLPDLPEDTDPETLSFLVASAMDLEVETKLELLALRKTSARLAQLTELLARVVENYEERARVHKVAHTNGHSGKKLEI